MNTPHCLIPIETKVRSLDGRLLLALRLAGVGYRTLLGGKSTVEPYARRAAIPYLFINKSLTIPGSHLRDVIACTGSIFITMDEEGGVYHRNWQTLQVRNPAQDMDKLDLMFCWGEEQRERLLAMCPDAPAGRIVVTGHPRFDLCKPQYRPYYQAMLGEKKPDMDYVLINTVFSFANNQIPIEDELSFYKKAHGELHDHSFCLRCMAYQKKLLQLFLACIRRLASHFSDLIFVVRPHPNENRDYYVEEFGDVPNVLVTNEGSVVEWISGALLVVHHDCTTAIETALSGREFVSYAPIEDEEVVQEIPFAISEKIRTPEDLIKRILAIRNGETFAPARRQACLDRIRPIIANIDFDAARRMATTVAEHFPLSSLSRPLTMGQRIQRARFNFRDRVSGKIASLRNSIFAPETMKGYAKRSKNKFPGLTEEEVRRRVAQYRELDASIPEVRLSSPMPHAVLIEPTA